MSGETRRFGLIYQVTRWLLKPWISRIRTLNVDLETLRGLQQRGQTLCVGHVVSYIDFLIINEYLARHGCQTLAFTHGLNPFLVLPFRPAWRQWRALVLRGRQRREAIQLEFLFEALAEGGHGLLFLKKANKRPGGKIHYYQGIFGRLATQAADRDQDVYFVPTAVFLTRMRKKNTRRTLYEIFFGTYDVPGRFRKALQLFFNFRKGGLVFSRHIDFAKELAKLGDLPEGSIGKRFRWTLLLHLNQEDRAYRGTTKRTVGRKVRKILKERRLNQELEKVAKRQKRSLDSVRREAEKTLRHIASDTSERMINLLRILFDFVWARTVERIDIREEDLRKVREVSKYGSVVFLPCHRSHVDYLVFAYSFEVQGLSPPRFAAGENLAKWPLGMIFRRSGGFFIRRSFKGEVIFPLVFEAYIRHILRERQNLVFFMEGTRSRTGKLLPPKVGMLAMILDAWRQGVVDHLPLVPVTIDYGKVFEGQAYLHEVSGGEKQQENLASVIRSSKVLNRKHGVIRIRFGDPIFLSDYAKTKGLDRGSIGFRNKIPFLHGLGLEVLNRVNDMVTLTAGNIVAGLLLGNPRRGMLMKELNDLFVITVRHLRRRGVEMAFTEKSLDQAVENALVTFEKWETLVRVEVGGEVVLNIPEQKRAEMEYYKNNGLHFILDIALFCLGFQLLAGVSRTRTNVLAIAVEVFQLLHSEFVTRIAQPTEDIMNGASKALEHIGAIVAEGDRLVLGDYPPGRGLVQISAQLLVNFLESYFITAEAVLGLPPDFEMDHKKLLKTCLSRAKLLYAVGTVHRQESMNTVTFSNALEHFGKQGWLKVKRSDGQKYPSIRLNVEQVEAFKACRTRIHGWLSLLQ